MPEKIKLPKPDAGDYKPLFGNVRLKTQYLKAYLRLGGAKVKLKQSEQEILSFCEKHKFQYSEGMYEIILPILHYIFANTTLSRKAIVKVEFWKEGVFIVKQPLNLSMTIAEALTLKRVFNNFIQMIKFEQVSF